MATELLENPVIQVSGTATIGPNVEVANLCEIKESQVVTTSLRVAEIFERKHKTVLQAIRELDCSDGFRGQNFLPTLKTTQLPNNATRQDPFYFITRDGFIFLVMGFTGKTAAKYKEAYIYAFNEMEAKLRRQQEEERMLRRMQQSSTPTFADAPRVVHDLLQQTDGIVEIVAAESAFLGPRLRALVLCDLLLPGPKRRKASRAEQTPAAAPATPTSTAHRPRHAAKGKEADT